MNSLDLSQGVEMKLDVSVVQKSAALAFCLISILSLVRSFVQLSINKR